MTVDSQIASSTYYNSVIDVFCMADLTKTFRLSGEKGIPRRLAKNKSWDATVQALTNEIIIGQNGYELSARP